MIQLPVDIVNRILEYQGYYKKRNGKFMQQISPTDKRYDMLKGMPKKKRLYKNTYCVTIYKKNEEEQLYYKREIMTAAWADKVYWTMEVYITDYSNKKYLKWEKSTVRSIIHHCYM